MCVGRASRCYEVEMLGLEATRLPLTFVVRGVCLTVTTFLAHHAISRYFLHNLKSTAARVGLVAVLGVAHCMVVNYILPWHPYAVRELHIVVAITCMWKATELATQRAGETLSSFGSYCLYDALVMRPDLLKDAVVVEAKARAKNTSYGERLRVIAPIAMRALAQSVVTEVRVAGRTRVVLPCMPR
eukprot:298702-Chlamydomonas_euryale.AAC.3